MKKIFITYLPITVTCILALMFVALIFYGFNERKKVDAGIKLNQSSAGAPTWYSSGGTWTNRKMITIDPAKVATTTSLTNFPMLFSVVDPDLKFIDNGGKVASSTGRDILFTSSNGTTKLDHEIERYSSTTGETIMWVEIPTLSATTSTVIYMYFGNASASDQTNTTGTWNSNFKGVYHLPNGTTLTANDSTSNAKNGTLNFDPTAITGRVGGAASTTAASSQYITSAATLPSGTGDYSISAWVFRSSSANGTIARSGSINILVPTYGRVLRLSFEKITLDENASLSGATNVPIGRWSHVAGVCRNSVMFVYLNGVQDGTGSSCGESANTVNGSIAASYSISGGTYSSFFNGYLDEVRFLDTGLTNEWIKTEYNNQSDPSSFYAYGGLESQSSKKSSGADSPNINIRGGIKFR